MQRILNQTNSNIDMVASHLRSQLVILHNCLEMIERTNSGNDEYIVEAFNPDFEIAKSARRAD